MDSSVAAADFSLTTGGAAQSASHLQVIASSVLPPQHHPSLAEHIHDSSQVYVIPLHIMGTKPPAIVALSNTHQVVSLKLMDTNYLYW
jgi:hypothetical protein